MSKLIVLLQTHLLSTVLLANVCCQNVNIPTNKFPVSVAALIFPFFVTVSVALDKIHKSWF